jgi:hypothetical protein
VLKQIAGEDNVKRLPDLCIFQILSIAENQIVKTYVPHALQAIWINVKPIQAASRFPE